jgi:hypothetical protein
VDRVAEGARWKLGLERAAGVEVRCGLHDVGFDLEDVLECLVARGARRRREARATQELIGVRERDRARAGARERAEIVRADDDAVGGKRARRRRRGEGARQPAVLQIQVARRCGVPDLDRAEVRKVGLG